MSKSASKISPKEKKRLAKLQEQKLKGILPSFLSSFLPESKQQCETAVGFLEKANYAKALPALNSAIEINPENLEAFLLLF